MTDADVCSSEAGVSGEEAGCGMTRPSPGVKCRIGDIVECLLPNGLRLLVFPDSSSATVAFSLTYIAGSRHEMFGEYGVAHLLEHLMFTGTARFPDLLRQFADRGIRTNANTTPDRTTYFATMVPEPHSILWALEAEADRMLACTFAQDDLDRERDVTLNEIEEISNNVLASLQQRVAAVAYQRHGYGRSVLGLPSDIESLDLGVVRTFYQRFYRPDNAVLAIAGNVEVSWIVDAVVSVFENVSSPSQPLVKRQNTEPPQDAERQVQFRNDAGEHWVMTAFHVPAALHPDYEAVAVLGRVLSSHASGRIERALVASGPAALVGADLAHSHDPGLMRHFVSLPRTVSPAATLEQMLPIFNDLHMTLSDDEVERGKRALTGDLNHTLTDGTRFVQAVGEYVGAGDWRLGFMHRAQIRELTLADVQRVAGKYLLPNNRTVGLLIAGQAPRRVRIPSASEGRRSLPPSMPCEGGDRLRQTGTRCGDTGGKKAVEATLNGGHRLVLFPKRSPGDKTVACVRLHYGDEQSLFGRAAAAQALACMLARRTARRSRLVVNDALEALGTKIRINGGAGYCRLTIETEQAYLRDALELVGEMLREPLFTCDELDEWRRAQCAATVAICHEPRQIARLMLERHIRPYPVGDPRYVPLPDERISELTALSPDTLYQLHQELLGASFGATAIVGHVDAGGSDVPGTIERLFGSWPSPSRHVWPVIKYQSVAAANITVAVRDKPNAAVIAALPVQMSENDPSYAALLVAAYVVGGGLNSRLATRLRQRERLSYMVGARLTTTPLSNRSVFSAYAVCNPRQIGRLEELLLTELQAAVRLGVTEPEMNSAKTALVRTRIVQRGSDVALAEGIATDSAFGLGVDRRQQLDLRVMAVTADTVSEVFSQHIKPTDLTIAKAGEFSGSPACREPLSSHLAVEK